MRPNGRHNAKRPRNAIKRTGRYDQTGGSYFDRRGMTIVALEMRPNGRPHGCRRNDLPIGLGRIIGVIHEFDSEAIQ